jgi:hypothetical protein
MRRVFFNGTENPHGFKLVSSRSTTNIQDVEVPTNFSSRWSLSLLSTGSDCDPLKPRQKIGLQLDYILPLRCSAGSNWPLVLEFRQIQVCHGREDHDTRNSKRTWPHVRLCTLEGRVFVSVSEEPRGPRRGRLRRA